MYLNSCTQLELNNFCNFKFLKHLLTWWGSKHQVITYFSLADSVCIINSLKRRYKLLYLVLIREV